MSTRVRYMRLLVFFDLPIETASQRKAYRLFRKFLLKSGYIMVQESVYSKLAIDGKAVDALISKLRQNRPPEGLVQVLQVTEKQYAGMVSIVGEALDKGEIVSTDTLVVL